MPYDEVLADRLRERLQACSDVVEKRMFGGLAFMVGGHMCCGVTRDDLMVRVGPDDYGAALDEPHVREMDFTGRPLRGFVYVSPEGIDLDRDLDGWVARAVRFASSLPRK